MPYAFAVPESAKVFCSFVSKCVWFEEDVHIYKIKKHKTLKHYTFNPINKILVFLLKAALKLILLKGLISPRELPGRPGAGKTKSGSA